MKKSIILLYVLILSCGPTAEEINICENLDATYDIVQLAIRENEEIESKILNSLINNEISSETAYELQLEVINVYSLLVETWRNTVPDNNNIEFWNNWLEIYQLRELSAIYLGQAYYVYEDIDTYDNSLFSESNYYLEQAVSLVGKKAWNSC